MDTSRYWSHKVLTDANVLASEENPLGNIESFKVSLVEKHAIWIPNLAT